jgi:hypothetical protein
MGSPSYSGVNSKVSLIGDSGCPRRSGVLIVVAYLPVMAVKVGCQGVDEHVRGAGAEHF